MAPIQISISRQSEHLSRPGREQGTWQFSGKLIPWCFSVLKWFMCTGVKSVSVEGGLEYVASVDVACNATF